MILKKINIDNLVYYKNNIDHNYIFYFDKDKYKKILSDIDDIIDNYNE